MAGLLTNSERAQKRAEVAKLNEQAMSRFSELFEQRHGVNSQHAKTHWEMAKQVGLPAFRHEDWHYTPLNTVLEAQYRFSDSDVEAKDCEALALPIDAYRLVLIDGRYSSALSSIDMGPFQVSLLDNQDLLPSPVNSEIFLHLTESLAVQPLVVHLAANKIAEKPLYLLNISTGSSDKQATNISQYRYHLTLDANSKAQVIEHYVSLNDQMHMTGSRLTVEVGDNADFSHFKLNIENGQAQHFAHNDIVIGRDSRVKSTSFLLGALLTRNHTSARLDGENTEFELNSLLLPKGNEIADTRTYLEHNKGYCNSRQLHKVIAMDSSKAVFNGMIKVAPNALKTDGQMTNNTLLLGEKAEIDTKPQLEIYADDVKCGHGATVGRIDDEQLFYLRSRGIEGKAAKHMIIIAFAAELTESIESEELKHAVMANIRQRLAEV
ncbi:MULTISPECIES: Fe-S cluster assembly protein SufD [Providencia]|uniref:FeS cluster assembly protein sufD n=2 Tax=Providencia TaxID=586 RepID=A0A9N8D0E6_PRORE|nr:MULTISPECIES: Fe-S cluster assembly protein SufD [Providencia]MRF66330.1 Fe-S cluster assembly protein SufD [Escherichia coli]EHZ6872846.1 Fe-S cluster assembly protein SufD [Providencia rettgeri]MBN6366110.1 Fe-S cluster assembly protein SufD [Providencia rettgeri]MBN7840804.1 Fe-S cluster assembly protein SufD [Providencia rettgeri]MBN7855131.1 Fe-S cluster assembly protein SufD [Providencia rettgeri]